MNQNYLINNPWWDEPELVAVETQYYQSQYSSSLPLYFVKNNTLFTK